MFLFVLHERVLIHFVCYQAGCDVVFSEAEPQVPGTQEPRLDRGGDEISLEMAANPPVLGSPTPVEDSGAGNVVSTGRSTPRTNCQSTETMPGMCQLMEGGLDLRRIQLGYIHLMMRTRLLRVRR